MLIVGVELEEATGGESEYVGVWMREARNVGRLEREDRAS
jgi:hypothetical protein